MNKINNTFIDVERNLFVLPDIYSGTSQETKTERFYQFLKIE